MLNRDDLAVLSGGDYSIGYGINEQGVVAGMSTAPGDATRAVALQNKKLRDLGQDGETSSANDINAAGDVAGFVNWNLLTAFAINDEGQIAGLGLKNGEFRGILLKKK